MLWRLVALAGFFVATTPGAVAAPVSVDDQTVRERIIQAVAHERQVYGAGGTVPGVLVGVWDGSGHSFVKGFGKSDLKSGAPFSPDDYVRIGSNTKTFIVTVLLQLVDEGRLSLDDPLSRFDIGVKVPDADHMTIRQLCQMRSGLFEVYDVPQLKEDVPPDSQWNPRQLVRWAVQQKPVFAPGKGYHYSNTNYLLLGLVIESVTGHSVKSEVEDRLLKPFGLARTFYPATMEMPTPWAHGYAAGSPHSTWKDVSNTVPVSLMGAAGNMISDLEDMRHWVDLYVRGKTNSPATQKERLQCLPTGQGDLGFGLGIGCGNGWFGYTGGLPGYNTAAWLNPESNVTALVFVTDQAAKPAPGVANAILRDIAQIVTPGHVPFDESDTGAKSGL
ncbi:serine hydrolase domain-containing protein [Acidomonas methanolica]|uniref:serine hydrolase domain-containing protein n=1 Tax=Acidomonas methanolica TaxID=437 RepID=UPI00211A3561|nr:serine hydrolase domain-containing protein [Acidomonas methanolica]MCQ9155382.1 beta-lactamase family protein [Acidomonas methanolica]